MTYILPEINFISKTPKFFLKKILKNQKNNQKKILTFDTYLPFKIEK